MSLADLRASLSAGKYERANDSFLVKTFAAFLLDKETLSTANRHYRMSHRDSCIPQCRSPFVSEIFC
jgi:hypothetical protein